jgi:hypothetical protein
MLETGRYGTIDELSAAEKINSSYVSRLLRLTLLSPAIIEAVLDGRQPEKMTLPGLMEPFPVEWGRQPTARRKLTTLDSCPPANIAREKLWYAGIAPCPAL